MYTRLLTHAEDVPETVVALVNSVYLEAERGLWQPGVLRTRLEWVDADMAHGQLVGAFDGSVLVGCVRVASNEPRVGEFGMLATAPSRRGTGIGAALVDYAEWLAGTWGCTTMQLDLLVPRVGTHPEKERLKGWYGRRGYELSRVEPLDARYPQLTPNLAVACDLEIYARAL